MQAKEDRVMTLLLARGVPKLNPSLLQLLMKDCNDELVLQFIAGLPLSGISWKQGGGVLCAAVSFGRDKLVSHLLTLNPMLIGQSDSWGNNALHLAAWNRAPWHIY